MTISTFADKHRLKVQLSKEDGTKIIAGRFGHIYEYDDSELGVTFMPPKTAAEPWGKWCPKRWGNFKRQALPMGMTLRQNGDSEGCLSFDPANKEQVKLAIKIAKVRPKRQLSPEQAAAGAARLAQARLKRQNTKLEEALAA